MDEGIAPGARARELALLLGIGLTRLQRWRRQFAGAEDAVDRRKGSRRYVAHRLSEEERQRILLTCNEPEFAALPPGQIVPILADRGLFIGSERSFYRVLHCHGQATAVDGLGHHRSRALCHGCGPMGQIRCGAGTSPICPPPSEACGSTSI
jgi:hypothetical protein